jgi:hypothetical protein
MANNRMSLVNKTTGVRIYLAKYYPSTGWYPPSNILELLNIGFESSDFGHLTIEERGAKASQVGFGPPYAQGGMWGDDWHLVYEETDLVAAQNAIAGCVFG